jgi:SAM-dependent methyltransferase
MSSNSSSSSPVAKGPHSPAAYFETWDDSVFSSEQKIYRVVELVTRGLVRGDVVDMGCGSRVYYDLSEVKRWVGLDLSPTLLEQLKFTTGNKPAGPVETLCTSCRDMPLEDATFDTVVAIFVLHHLAEWNRTRTKANVLEALRQARRVLRDDGTMIILETWPQFLLHFYHFAYPVLYPLARRLWKVELPYFLGPGALEKLAHEAGFRECYAMAVRLYEDVRQPVLGIVLPAWAQRLVQKYTIYIVKP